MHQSLQLLPNSEKTSKQVLEQRLAFVHKGDTGGERFRGEISQIVAGLKKCSQLKDLETGTRLHRAAFAIGIQSNRYVVAALISMYSKCRVMAPAREVFEGGQRDVFTWTALILGYVNNGESLLALELFNRMDCPPDSFTFAAALKACGALARESSSMKSFCLETGMKIHEKMMKCSGYGSDLVLATSLLDMYCKCGCMKRAREVFNEMKQRNVFAWTSLMLGYVSNGESEAALELFTSGEPPADSLIYVAALKACGSLASGSKENKENFLKTGMKIHKQLQKSFESDSVLGTALMDMYCKCRCMASAKEVFDAIHHPSVVTWNALLLGYVNNGESFEAIRLFGGMSAEPDAFTYAAVLKACGSLAIEKNSDKSLCLREGRLVHRRARERGLESNIVVSTSLLDMYSKCGSIACAREVFDRMTRWDVVAWSSLILGYVENGESSTAIQLFNEMDSEPDSFTYVAVLKAYGSLASGDEPRKLWCLNQTTEIHKRVKEKRLASDMVLETTLLDVYRKCGSMDQAREVFDSMPRRDPVAWTSLILGYAENGEGSSAMEMFTRMVSSSECEPYSLTFVAALKACGSLGTAAAGREIHGEVCKRGLEQEQVVANTLMDFYCKSGSMITAENLFNTMHSPDVVSWTSLITGFSSASSPARVFGYLKEMHRAGVQMDAITLSSVLTLCSRAGLVEEARGIMEQNRSSLIVEHYNCLIDALGRANRAEEALELIRGMPFRANGVTWRTLLAACSKWRNVEVGKVAFDSLVAAGGDDRAAAYVLMSDIYSSPSHTSSKIEV